MNAWRVKEEDVGAANAAKGDKEEAFKYILPETTMEVELLKDEHEFFTNQCYQEVRRMSMINYDVARENFVNMGEMMIRLIY